MQTDTNLARLADLDDYEIAHDDPDVSGWKVKTSDGEECGKVDGLIVDTAAMQVRYLDVKLDKKTFKLNQERHALIPISDAQLDDKKDDVLLASMTAAQLLAIPPYMPGGPIILDKAPPPQKEHFKKFYGKRGGSGDVQRMTLSEEQLKVGKRQKQSGEVDVHKTVETEHVSQKVPLMHEEVTVERRAVSPDSPDADGISESETRIPLMAEEAVVEKRAVAKEELVISKKQVQGEQTVDADLKREHVDVERDGKPAKAGAGQDKIAQKWPQIKDKVRTKWSKLTDQDLNVPQGDSRYLAAKLQERYGEPPQQAQQHVQEFSRTLG